MYSRLKYNFELSKLNRECEKIRKRYNKIKAEAKREEWQELRSEEGSYIVPLLERKAVLITRDLCRRANSLLVPLPDRSNKEFWEELHYEYGQALTDKGIWKIKEYIHEEKRQRRESFLCWVTPLIGLIGALIGLIAVLKK
jgi:hypothetical protein